VETYAHIKTVLGIILGLSITHSLKGAVKFIDHPNRVKSYAVHLLWAFYMFLNTVYFWWFEVHLAQVQHWSFLKYFFLIIYVITYFVLAAILFPDDIKEYKDYREYFYSRKKWFFSILALLFAFDAIDTYIKGPGYLSEMLKVYPIREFLHISGCFWAMNTSKTWVQLFIVISFILFQFFWILRYY